MHLHLLAEKIDYRLILVSDVSNYQSEAALLNDF